MAIQTRPTGADVTAFLDSVEDETRRQDAHRLRAMIEQVTGAPGTMWGPAIVGFGSVLVQGRTGETEWMALGFSPRKAALTLYGIYSENRPVEPLFEQLGPHTTAKGCLYIKRLGAIDENVLERLILAAWDRSNEVELPPELVAALAADPVAAAAFDKLASTHRKEHARSIAEANAPETKQRRVDATMAKLRGQ